jgi:Uma2 family endonuclease
MSVITAAVSPVSVSLSADPADGLWRLSVEKYHEMIEAGILVDDDPVELLEGLLMEKMSKNPAHVFAAQSTRLALERLTPAGWFINTQDPITTLESEPEPDVSVVRGGRREYLARHPFPQDLALVVEVSDSSLRRDHTMKQRVYARASVPAYWIVNLIDGRIEVYTDPTGPEEKPSYRQRNDYSPADEVPFLIEGREIGRIAVRDLLP